MTERLRGMRDITGMEALQHEYTVRTCVDIAKLFGYELHFTPTMENSEVFLRSLGDTSDIVSKETYTFSDRDKRSVTLRPEFTASIVRSLLKEQNIRSKLVSYGSLFRHERPQKGRFREFTQVNFESIGYGEVQDDVELILIGEAVFNKLNVKRKLLINTLGDTGDRRRYSSYLREYFTRYKSSLSEDSKRRLERNPLRILDSKAQEDQDIIRSVKSFQELLSSDSKIRFDELKELLGKMSIEYTIDDKLVRGLRLLY